MTSSALVVTAIGPDRQGLVGELAACVARAGGNIAYSRMGVLCGRFTILALVEGSEVTLERVRASLAAEAERLGLRIELEASTTRGSSEGLPYVIRAYGLDQPGIVHAFTSALNAHRVNIEELASTTQSTRFSEALAFSIEAKVSIPASRSVRAVRQALEQMGHTMNVDVMLEPAQTAV